MIIDKFDTFDQFRSTLTLNKKICEILTSKKQKMMEGMGKSFCPFKETFILKQFTSKIEYSSFSLIYKASDDGFKSEDFHNNCDNFVRVILMIKANDYIFGSIFYFLI